MTQNHHTAAIAALNDEFRQQAGLLLSNSRAAPGRCFVTRGIASLGREAQHTILARVREFSAFTAENDPHREHDFGAITAAKGQQVFWKIDYFADEALESGSEDPADPRKSFRVLTVMLAAEY